MSHQREMNRLVREAKQRGWTVEKTPGGHWQFRRPGSPSLYSASTPQDVRTIANTAAMLRRHEPREKTCRTKTS